MGVSLYTEKRFNLTVKENYYQIINKLNEPVKVDIESLLNEALSFGKRKEDIDREIDLLKNCPGQITEHEYYYYRLWETKYPETFAGREIRFKANDICNSKSWLASASNKLLFYIILNGADIPYPNIKALVHSAWEFPNTLAIKSFSDLLEFLYSPSNYPFFAKPVYGSHGLGAISAEKLTDGQIHLNDGSKLTPIQLIESFPFGKGYIIQKLLKPDFKFSELNSETIYTCRLLILNTLKSDSEGKALGPIIHRGALKIATGQNVADNFWLPGNLLASVDVKTGKIKRAILNTENGLVFDPIQCGYLKDFKIPGWEDACSLAIRAASVFSGLRLQSWDIAITNEGPVALELNCTGDFNLLQLGQEKGVYDYVFSEHLNLCSKFETF